MTDPAALIPETIADIIRLAVAPVFLIAGIGAILTVLTARLGRVVDRVRMLEDRLCETPDGPERDRMLAELPGLERRMTTVNFAIAASTLAALFTCVVIVLLFLGELISADLAQAVAALFIATMGALIIGLCFFLAELFIATRMLHVRADLLETHKPPPAGRAHTRASVTGGIGAPPGAG